MTTEHSISGAAALMIGLSLSPAAFDQLLTIAGADGSDVTVSFDLVQPELARLVTERDGIAHLNFIGTAVLRMVLDALKQSMAAS